MQVPSTGHVGGQNPLIPPPEVSHDLPLPSDPPKNTWEKVADVIAKVLTVLKEIVWKFVNETNKLAKQTIKTITELSASLKEKLGSIIPKLGILSLISLMMSIREFPSHIRSLVDHIRVGDSEGIAFGVLSILQSPVEMLEGLTTVTGSLVAFGVIPGIAFFAMIAAPLAIALLGIAAIKGVYDLIRMGISLHQLPKALHEGNVDKFKEYIEETIGITAKERAKIERQQAGKEHAADLINREIKILKDRKRRVYIRHADAKAYTIMVNLQKHLSAANADLAIATSAVKDMRTILARKITATTINTACSVAMIVALSCLMATPVAPAAVPIVAGVKAAVAIGVHAYTKFGLYKGLRVPEFAKAVQ